MINTRDRKTFRFLDSHSVLLTGCWQKFFQVYKLNFISKQCKTLTHRCLCYPKFSNYLGYIVYPKTRVFKINWNSVGKFVDYFVIKYTEGPYKKSILDPFKMDCFWAEVFWAVGSCGAKVCLKSEVDQKWDSRDFGVSKWPVKLVVLVITKIIQFFVLFYYQCSNKDMSNDF